jgi:hypothetical protein
MPDDAVRFGFGPSCRVEDEDSTVEDGEATDDEIPLLEYTDLEAMYEYWQGCTKGGGSDNEWDTGDLQAELWEPVDILGMSTRSLALTSIAYILTKPKSMPIMMCSHLLKK